MLNVASDPLTIATVSSPRSQRPNQATLREMLQQIDASEVVACKDMLVNLLSNLGVQTQGISLDEAKGMRKHLKK